MKRFTSFKFQLAHIHRNQFGAETFKVVRTGRGTQLHSALLHAQQLGTGPTSGSG